MTRFLFFIFCCAQIFFRPLFAFGHALSALVCWKTDIKPFLESGSNLHSFNSGILHHGLSNPSNGPSALLDGQWPQLAPSILFGASPITFVFCPAERSLSIKSRFSYLILQIRCFCLCGPGTSVCDAAGDHDINERTRWRFRDINRGLACHCWMSFD